MDFVLPTASKERLEELLVYLGDRADDFKKCFDIDSEWCWKYADLVLRGTNSRELSYSERHHIVPMAYYKMLGYKGDRWAKRVSFCNLTNLSYIEHIYAHYCILKCSTEGLQEKLAFAFWCLYNNSKKNYKGTIRNLSESDMLPRLSELEQNQVKMLMPRIRKVSDEGRTHTYEDPVLYKHDYHVANRDTILAKKKVYAVAHKEEKAEYDKQHEQLPEVKARRKELYNTNKDIKAEKRRQKYAEQKDHINEVRRKNAAEHREEKNKKHREYTAMHRDQVNASARKSYRKNKDARLARDKIYRSEHKAEKQAYNKTYHEEHKDEIHAQQKEYRERRKDHIHSKAKQHYDEMVAKGYRYLTNHTTGKRGWVFVGLPNTGTNVA